MRRQERSTPENKMTNHNIKEMETVYKAKTSGEKKILKPNAKAALSRPKGRKS